jgi:hypothetical protein
MTIVITGGAGFTLYQPSPTMLKNYSAALNLVKEHLK